MAGIARQTSVHKPARMSCLRPLCFTTSVTLGSSQVLMKVRSIGFCSGNTSCRPLMMKPPRSCSTVVRIVGTLKSLAAFASTITLLMIIAGS